jgi:hypothetical protein
VKHPEVKQKGVVLLLLLLVFLMAGTALMLGNFNNRQEIYVRQQAELSNQLYLAKEALLAFAANSSALYSNSRGPGFFPCPDTSNTGIADTACDSGSVNLGRLPEYIEISGNKIFFNAYYAEANQQFWYAIAPHYIYAETDEDDRKALNRVSIEPVITSSRLTLDATDNIVALILAPGESLSFQNRAADPLDSSNFLEGGNDDNDTNFFTASAADPSAFNDQLIAITHDELMAYIGSNVAMAIKRLLDADYNLQSDPKHYPGDHADFVMVLASHAWLTDLTGPNNEQWAGNTIYTLISATEASLTFNECPGMSFTLNHDGGVTRIGHSC